MSLYLVGASNPETHRQIAAHEDARALIGLEPEIVGFIDNDRAKRGTSFCGLPVVGPFESVPMLLANHPEARFVNLITRNQRTRCETNTQLAEMGCRFANLIHPAVDLSEVMVGENIYVQDGVRLQAAAHLGDDVVIHAGALVSHECSLDIGVFLAPGVVLCGRVTVGWYTFVGANATVIPDVTIGEWATIGAGAVVIEDVKPYTTVVGNPAQVVRWHYDNRDRDTTL